jgi:hypothetical protein
MAHLTCPARCSRPPGVRICKKYCTMQSSCPPRLLCQSAPTVASGYPVCTCCGIWIYGFCSRVWFATDQSTREVPLLCGYSRLRCPEWHGGTSRHHEAPPIPLRFTLRRMRMRWALLCQPPRPNPRCRTGNTLATAPPPSHNVGKTPPASATPPRMRLDSTKPRCRAPALRRCPTVAQPTAQGPRSSSQPSTCQVGKGCPRHGLGRPSTQAPYIMLTQRPSACNTPLSRERRRAITLPPCCPDAALQGPQGPIDGATAPLPAPGHGSYACTEPHFMNRKHLPCGGLPLAGVGGPPLLLLHLPPPPPVVHRLLEPGHTRYKEEVRLF